MSVENSESSASAYHTQERKKSNLAFAFFCMEKDRAKDMEVLYAFCRLMDDIADDEGPAPEAKRATLDEWKREISSIYEGSDKLSPLGREMKDIIERRRIPQEYLQAIIDGVMRDTFDDEYETFEDVRKYCYGVASAVGLASIYVFGFKNPRTKEFAESLGYALQFTNILRDVVDDARTLKRSYVPSCELEAFGVRKEDLADPSKNPNCKKLFAFMYFRAKHFFNKSRRLLPAEDKRSLAPALIMWAIYEKILESLKGLDFEIPAKPFKISKFGKIRLALDAIKRSKVPDAENKTYGRALVLGGGIAGMQTAVRLCSEGFDVELVEARANMGGRASALEWRGARLDNGTHALMGCYDNFFGFLKSMSVDPDEYFARTSCMDFIFNGGKKVKVGFPEKNANMLEQIFLILRYCKLDGFGSFKNLWLLAKLKMGMAPSMQGESAGEYLRRMKIPEAAVRNFWDPFCVSALNTTLDKASAKLMTETLGKCILKGGDCGILYLPRKAIVDSFYPIAKTYIEGCGGKVAASETAKGIFVENGKVAGISTNKRERIECDHLFSAVNLGAAKQILPDALKCKTRLADISENDILNIYFTTTKKVLDGEYACLIGSPLHWLFDHTPRIENNAEKIFLYGATVSASSLDNTKSAVETLIKGELEKFFGKETAQSVRDVLPSLYRGATISGDIKSEAARQRNAEAEADITNLHLCGDWIQTGLPCTIESASKSANDLRL